MIAESGRLDRTAGSEEKFLSRRRQLVTPSPRSTCQLVLIAHAVLLRLFEMYIFLKWTVAFPFFRFFFLEYTKMLKFLKFPILRFFFFFQQWAPNHTAFHDRIGCFICNKMTDGFTTHTHIFFHFSSSFHRATTLVFVPKKSRRLSLQKRLAVRCGLIPTSAASWSLGNVRLLCEDVGLVRVCVCAHAQTYRRRPSESSLIRTAHGWDPCTLATCEVRDE